MTEYELLYLLEEYRANMSVLHLNVLTIISAYLVVAFLYAHRLTRTMVIFINSLFVVMLLGTALVQSGIGESMAYIRGQMVQMEQEGAGLAGNPIIDEPDWMADVFRYGSVFLTVFAMIGALYFFFHARRTNGARAKNAVVNKIDKAMSGTDNSEDTP